MSLVYRRPLLLGICVIVTSGATTLTGVVSQYWELMVLRILLAIG